MIIYLRAETYPNEYRVPLVPHDIKTLISQGHRVYVQSSQARYIPDSEYTAVGAEITKSPWWEQSSHTLIIGLKTLDSIQNLNKHTHIYFSHSYRGQDTAKTILTAFAQSSSKLYDLEYFHTPEGIRVLAFGLYAGQVGAALGLRQHYNRSHGHPDIQGLKPWPTHDEMMEFCKSAEPRILIIGNGRCAQGVKDIMEAKKLPYTIIGKNTQPNLAEYDIVFNCILLDPEYNNIWIKSTDIIEKPKPLLIVDISCDYSKPNNPIAIYNTGTTFQTPVYNYNNISIIAIDNLPSLLPRESSTEFSNRLTDLLLRYEDPCWKANLATYYRQHGLQNL